MRWIEVFFLALALSMDAFAVAIGLGAKHRSKHQVSRFKLAWLAAIYFGLFQGLMPLLGYLGGKGVLGWVQAYAAWVAFVLLLFIGGKMVYESFSQGIEKDIQHITHHVMLLLAIATSIDALAAGFALNLLKVDPYVACLIIAATTCAFSYAGVILGALLGSKSGSRLENRAGLFGGAVLILMGFKLLLF